MKRIILCTTIMSLATLGWAQEEAYPKGFLLTGKIERVTDGDTARVKTGDKTIKVRFWGVDTPESRNDDQWPSQPYSKAAAQFTKAVVEGREVMVRMTGEFTYGRHVGEIFVDGRSVSRELVRAGLGHWYDSFARHDTDLRKLEETAKRERRGLWADPNVIDPGKWRNQMDHNCDQTDAC